MKIWAEAPSNKNEGIGPKKMKFGLRPQAMKLRPRPLKRNSCLCPLRNLGLDPKQEMLAFALKEFQASAH